MLQRTGLLVTILMMLLFSGNILFVYGITSSKKIRVAVSVQSLEGIVRDISGEYIDIISILPAGAEPHNYQLPPDKITMLKDADLFIFTGHFAFEDVLERAYPNKEILTLNKTSITYDGYKIKLLSVPRMKGYNPHGYWIYPDNAFSIAEAVADKLSALDPDHAPFYKNNLALFRDKIKLLKDMYKDIAEEYNLAGEPLVIGFPAEQYFVAPLNMDIIAVIVKGEGLTISGNELQTAREKLLESDKPLIIASGISKMLSVSSIFNELSSDTGARIAFVSIVDTNIDSYIGMMYYNLGIVSSTLSSMQYKKSTSSSVSVNYALAIFSITLILIMIIESIYIVRLREVD